MCIWFVTAWCIVSCDNAGSRPGRLFHWGTAPSIVQHFSVSTGDQCFQIRFQGFNRSVQQPATISSQRAGHEFCCLCLTGGVLLVPWGVCRASVFKRILRTVTSAAIGITTGLLLDSAQLVCLLELVAGSENFSRSASHFSRLSYLSADPAACPLKGSCNMNTHRNTFRCDFFCTHHYAHICTHSRFRLSLIPRRFFRSRLSSTEGGVRLLHANSKKVLEVSGFWWSWLISFRFPSEIGGNLKVPLKIRACVQGPDRLKVHNHKLFKIHFEKLWQFTKTSVSFLPFSKRCN